MEVARWACQTCGVMNKLIIFKHRESDKDACLSYFCEKCGEKWDGKVIIQPGAIIKDGG